MRVYRFGGWLIALGMVVAYVVSGLVFKRCLAGSWFGLVFVNGCWFIVWWLVIAYWFGFPDCLIDLLAV